MTCSFPRSLALVVLLAFALASGRAHAQEQTFDSIAGAWWFRVAGKDAGALLVQFGEPAAASFAVEDISLTDYPSFGFTRGVAAFFVIDKDQTLSFDSKGNVIGELDLTSPDPNSPESVGTLVIDKGKPNKLFTRLKLRATIQAVDGPPLVVKLDGRRVPVNFPVLTGLAPDGKLGGKGVKSRVFELGIRSSATLGLPAYTFTGNGPVEIDGVEVPDVSMTGTVVLSPDKRIYGLLEESSDFGTGDLAGKLHLPDTSVIPKLKLTASAERKLSVKGNLTEPIEPVLSVTPTTFDFGAIRLDAAPRTQIFSVANVGLGLLTGEAEFQSGSSTDFTFVGAATYTDRTPEDPPVPITVQFDPSVAGTKSAQILFRVAGGAGSRLVNLTGTGGVPTLTVLPTVGVFGEVVVLQPRTLPFTISNTGDGPLEGNATIILGATDFALVLTAGGTTVPSIPYTIEPGGNLVVLVRFTPTTAAQKTGTLNLSGGTSAQVALTGTGTP